MAKDDFLDDNVEEKGQEEAESQESAQEEEIEKIKLGEEEYTEQELERFVKLGKIGAEAEEKFDTKIDKIWPEFTKSRQELKELKDEAERRAEEQVKTKVDQGQTLSTEEQRKVARQQAKELGILLDDDFDKLYMQRRSAERLTEQAEDAVQDAQDKYGIKTSTKEVLEHMGETGIRDPEKAIKDKFETRIDKWKEEQLTKNRGSGLVTESSSTAGGKEPEPVKVTRDNLHDLVAEALKQG